MSERRASAPPPPTLRDGLVALGLLVALVCVAFPFIGLGAFWAHRCRKVLAPPTWLVATCLCVSGVVLGLSANQMVPFAWLRTFLPADVLATVHLTRTTWQMAAAQSIVEPMFGPLLYAAAVGTSSMLLRGSIRHQQDRRDIEARRVHALVVNPRGARIRYAPIHPHGFIRLGYVLRDGSPFDIRISMLGVGGAIIGQPGMGKTVVLARLVDGLLASIATLACVVVVLDGKEDAGLREKLRDVATIRGVPFYEISSAPWSAPYDAMSGGNAPPEVVTAQIVATMDFGVSGLIYREIGAHVLFRIVRGLQEVGDRVSLPRISECLTTNGLLELAGRTTDLELRALAKRIGQNPRSAEGEAVSSMSHRLGRLLASKYGRLLVPSAEGSSISLEDVASQPGLLYIGVSTHGGGGDARLLVNVILSDLGELARKRNEEIAQGRGVVPLFLFIDEFAQIAHGGSEAETAAAEARLSNSFELARSSQISPFPAMQVLPHTEELLSDVFGSGLLIVLRTAQAEEVSKRLGTVPGGTITHKLESDGHTAAHGEGTYTPEAQWAVSPDTIRRAGVGVAIVRLHNSLPVEVLLQHETWAPRPSTLRRLWERLFRRARREQ